MVVTPSTTDSEPQERLAEDVDHVVVPVGFVLPQVDRRMTPFTQVPESRRQDRFVVASLGMTSWPRQQVAGDMLDQEHVVGHIVVECTDDVVAVFPSVGRHKIRLVTSRLGKPDQVEPVPGPVLAVSGAGQQPVDDRLVSRVGSVAEKRIDF